MVDPCGNCRCLSELLEAEVIVGSINGMLSENASSFWSGFSQLSDAVPKPGEATATEMAAIDQMQAKAAEVTPNILSDVQMILLDLEEGVAAVDSVECGDAPVNCPKLTAFAELFTVIGGRMQSVRDDNPLS